MKYTLDKIKKLYPEILKKYNVLCVHPKRPTINHYSDFSEEQKFIWSIIVDKIKEINPTQNDLKCWAIGSRVNGNWRTRQEAELLFQQGYPLKYSDWDVATNAEVLPNKQTLNKMLSDIGEKVHIIYYKTIPNKIAVPLLMEVPA